jgi:DnaJ family protein C protein 5
LARRNLVFAGTVLKGKALEQMTSHGSRTHHDSISKRNLYEVLELEKSATDDDIKRAYRKLALIFHPDKNRDGDPAKTERFKEINHAHAVLSNPQKRRIYDEYGDMGLRMMDQVGEETMAYVLRPWVKYVFWTLTILTCGCFGCCCGCLCCCQCCCNFCCGKCKPDMSYEDYPDINEIVQESGEEITITVQPNASHAESATTAHAMPTPTTPIVLGPPSSPPSYQSTQQQ